jgi:hypothetical protein
MIALACLRRRAAPVLRRERRKITVTRPRRVDARGDRRQRSTIHAAGDSVRRQAEDRELHRRNREQSYDDHGSELVHSAPPVPFVLPPSYGA